ncbi:hypothetical protein THRCLA_23085 [Thraustotheca clavata]|uniref:Tc1-like transposase DDE domain-containing protein n=1 Tax=Thraustotheca clavata TaxID=74557 RepID=A0A1V9YF63_9STRA|nr:hypothetical protein THRCLA_23085 [Thraustotheca clavata]
MKYQSIDRYAAKLRVLDAARKSEVWRVIANILNVNLRTATYWISHAQKTNDWTPRRSKWGGYSYQKVTRNHVHCLLDALSYQPDLTLEEMASIIATNFGVIVSCQTINRHLEGELYTLKKLHYELEKMNNAANKIARRDYLIKLWQLQLQGKQILYVDETNDNTYCSRNYGRSKCGTRAVAQLIACISEHGPVYPKHLFGSNNKSSLQDFMDELYLHLSQFCDLNNVVIVLDNAPVHRGIEIVLEYCNYGSPTLLRLGPYSPMLNPIENVFSTFKTQEKSIMRARRRELLTVPEHSTIKAHRNSILIEAANDSYSVITEALCQACYANTLKFHDAVMNLDDVQVGT